MPEDDCFWQIHQGLPREGPGGNASTRRALSYLRLLEAPDLLDDACGPGMQTIEIARMTDGRITARYAPAVSRRGQASRDRGMAEIAPAGGYVVATHPRWLQAEVPPGARALGQDEAFEMTTVGANLAIIAFAGYAVVEHFVLPSSAWWDDYYAPIEAKLPVPLARYGNDLSAQRRIEDAPSEIEGYRRFGDSYGYVFFVMRTNAEGAIAERIAPFRKRGGTADRLIPYSPTHLSASRAVRPSGRHRLAIRA